MIPDKIELGAGANPTPGYFHCDIRRHPHIDVVCDSRSLPLRENSCFEVYLRHHLEHFTEKEGEQVLKEILRVLRPGGRVYIIVPNIDFHMRQFYDGDRRWAMAGFWGWQNNDYDIHKWGYNFEVLQEKLAGVGFINITNFTAAPGSRENDEKHLETKAEKGLSIS